VTIDRIGCTCCRTEAAYCSRHRVVETPLVDPGEQAGKKGLAGAAPPCLGNAARRSDNAAATPPCCFNQGRNVAITSVEGDQPTRVKDQAH